MYRGVQCLIPSPFLANCARFICIERRTAVVHIGNAEQHRTDFSIIKGLIRIGMIYNQHNLSVTSDFQHALSLSWSTPCPNHLHACYIVAVSFLLPFCFLDMCQIVQNKLIQQTLSGTRSCISPSVE